MIAVGYYDGVTGVCTPPLEMVDVRRNHTRRQALAAHGDAEGTGLDYARNPAGGCLMIAHDDCRDMWSAHGKGQRGHWGPWRHTLVEAVRAV